MHPVRRSGALALLNRAVDLVLRHPAALAVPTWAATVPLLVVLMGAYYLDRIIGLEGARWPLACAIGAGLIARARAHVATAAAASTLIEPASATPHLATLRWDELPAAARRPWVIAAVAAAGEVWWLTLALPWAGLGSGGFVVIVFWHALGRCLMPTWAPRCAHGAAGSVFAAALHDGAGQRVRLTFASLWCNVAIAALAANIGILLAVLAASGSALTGFDLTTLRGFVSADNDFFVATLTLAVTLILVDPVRPVLAALLDAERRTTEDAADLRSALAALQPNPNRAEASRVPRARLGTALAVVLAVGVVRAAQAAPQANEGPPRATPVTGTVAPTLDARHLAETIVRRPEFREPARSGRDAWLESMAERWAARAGDLTAGCSCSTTDLAPPSCGTDSFGTPRVPGRTRLPSGSFFATVAVALALIIGTGVILRRRGTVPPALATEVALAATGAMAADDYRALAKQHAREGRLADAVRALYLAALRRVHERGVMVLEPSMTNRAVLRGLPPHYPCATFAALLHDFERAWYGRKPLEPTTVEHCLERDAELERWRPNA